MAEHFLKLNIQGKQYTYQELKSPFIIEPKQSNFGTTEEYIKALQEHLKDFQKWIEQNNLISFDDEQNRWEDLIVCFNKAGLVPEIITWQALEKIVGVDIVNNLKQNPVYVSEDGGVELKVVIPEIIRL